MSNYDGMLHALSIKVPAFTWERISTGGGCTAICGSELTGRKRTILITDGDASEPAGFTSPACAIYYEDHNKCEERNSKPFTMIGHFWELLDWLVVDVAEWDNEKSPTQLLVDRLATVANDLKKYGIFHQFINDLNEAIYLINTHAGEQ